MGNAALQQATDALNSSWILQLSEAAGRLLAHAVIG